MIAIYPEGVELQARRGRLAGCAGTAGVPREILGGQRGPRLACIIGVSLLVNGWMSPYLKLSTIGGFCETGFSSRNQDEFLPAASNMRELPPSTAPRAPTILSQRRLYHEKP